MYVLDLENGDIEHLSEIKSYVENNRSELPNHAERKVKQVFEEVTDYNVGRTDSKSQYIKIDDRVKGVFRKYYGRSLVDLEFKGMPDQFHWKIENGEVTDYYFAEIKTQTSLRKTQLSWLKENNQYPRKIIYTR